MLEDINQKIKVAGLQTADKFINAYLENEDQIVNDINSFSGLHSEIYLHNRDGELEQLKFSSIFSDFTSMYTVSPDKSKHHMRMFDKGSPFNYDRDITIPTRLINEINPRFNLIPCYSYHTSSDLKKTIKYCEPLLDQSRALLRPMRTLWVDKKHLDGKKEVIIYYAHGNTNTRHWVIRDSFGKDTMTIENYLKPTKIQELMELTIPYFRDIKLNTLTQVLSEEEDCLSPLRQELKKLILNFDSTEGSLKELQQDILRPQIDSINRRFKNKKNIHAFTIAGSVSMFSLSLLKVFIPNLMVSDLISSIISGTSLSSMIVSEVSYQNEMNTLRENPYFLLWRLKKIS